MEIDKGFALAAAVAAAVGGLYLAGGNHNINLDLFGTTERPKMTTTVADDKERPAPAGPKLQ